MICCELSEQLIDYQHGELDGPMRARIGMHLEKCPDCRRKLAEIAEVEVLYASLPLASDIVLSAILFLPPSEGSNSNRPTAEVHFPTEHLAQLPRQEIDADPIESDPEQGDLLAPREVVADVELPDHRANPGIQNAPRTHPHSWALRSPAMRRQLLAEAAPWMAGRLGWRNSGAVDRNAPRPSTAVSSGSPPSRSRMDPGLQSDSAESPPTGSG